MKKSLIVLSLVCFGVMAFKTIEEKKYAVQFTEKEWNARYSWLTAVKQALEKSDLPSKDVRFINDSLITKFQNEIAVQLIPQFPSADTSKPKAPKKDSIQK